MFNIKRTAMTIAAVMCLSAPAFAAANVGEAAPDFTGTDVISGEEFTLSDHSGETVVLEWTNHLCPFVVKHYESGNMQKTQQEAKADGVKWITIVSSADGKQGNVSPEEAVKIVEDAGAHPSAKILDVSGEIGKAYGAKTTPHMFVIKDGIIKYAGAIDSDASPSQDAIAGAENYVLSALSDLKDGGEVKTSSSQPYGCSVKY